MDMGSRESPFDGVCFIISLVAFTDWLHRSGRGTLAQLLPCGRIVTLMPMLNRLPRNIRVPELGQSNHSDAGLPILEGGSGPECRLVSPGQHAFKHMDGAWVYRCALATELSGQLGI